jgi:hypothetical protein
MVKEMAKSEDATQEKSLEERQSGHSWDGPPLPGHKTASPDDRLAVVLALLDFHKGMHPSAALVINDARAVLDFVHDKSPP